MNDGGAEDQCPEGSASPGRPQNEGPNRLIFSLSPSAAVQRLRDLATTLPLCTGELTADNIAVLRDLGLQFGVHPDDAEVILTEAHTIAAALGRARRAGPGDAVAASLTPRVEILERRVSALLKDLPRRVMRLEQEFPVLIGRMDDAVAEASKLATDNLLRTSATANIEGVWVEPVADSHGGMGAAVHAAFTVFGMKAVPGQVACYLAHRDGRTLDDTNGLFATASGQVSAATRFVGTADPATFDDVTMFIPESELHCASGHTELRAFVTVWTGDANLGELSRPIASSDWANFTHRSSSSVASP